MSQNIHNIKE